MPFARVVNLKTEAYDVYCGRKGHGETGYFGNPFRGFNNREVAIEKFKAHFYNRARVDLDYLEAVLRLDGKRLGCFCAPLACHCDVYADFLCRVHQNKPMYRGGVQCSICSALGMILPGRPKETDYAPLEQCQSGCGQWFCSAHASIHKRIVDDRLEPYGWVGVDLDGTLATEESWRGYEYIGEPVAAMVEAVRELLAYGVEVRIFTARVAASNFKNYNYASAVQHAAEEHIRHWSKQHVGLVLPVTAEKDVWMVEAWDDRAVTIQRNAGIPATTANAIYRWGLKCHQ